MRTKEEAIAFVLKRKPKAGYRYPRFTCSELLNENPDNDAVRKAGVTTLANQMITEINPRLEMEHGVGLIPDRYDCTWLIVSLDERAAYVIKMRGLKLYRMAIGDPRHMERDCTLRETLVYYKSLSHLSTEMLKQIRSMERSLTAIEVVGREAFAPKLDRVIARLEPFEAEDDLDG